MRFIKRTLCFCLAAVMLFSVMPISAAATPSLTITSPVDWSKVDRNSTTLKWTKVDGAANYKLTIVNNSDSGALLTTRNMSVGNTTSYNITSYLQKIPVAEIPSAVKIWVGAYNSSDALICSDIVGEPSGNYEGIIVSAKPSITSGSASSITSNSAKLSVTVNKNYGSAIEDAGFYVGTSSNVSAAKQYSASSIVNNGTMTRTITGLRAGTKYYYWAYAENGIGETISSRSSFTTEDETPTSGISSISDAKEVMDFPSGSSSIGTVQKGRIRYVGQMLSDPKFSSSYWKNSKYDFVSNKSCQGMCTRAVFSMALSYLGIDLTPVKMSEITGLSDIDAPYDDVLDAMTGYPGVARVKTTVSQAYSNYLSNSNYSPVYLHFDYGSSLHCLLIVGKKSGNTYIAVDPSVRSNSASGMANEHVYEITVNENSKTITSVTYNGKTAWTSWNGATYTGANQWYLTGSTPSSYTITYDYGYGIDGFTSGSAAKVDKLTKQHGKNHVIIDSAYTKTGYKFLGWGVYPDVTTVKYRAGDVYATNANLYLYAVWEKASCSHSWGRWNSTGSTQHKRTCSLCGEAQTQSHSWGSWGTIGTEQHQRKCSVCSDTQKQSHTWGSWIDYSDSQHKHSCTVCSTTNYASHTWNSGVVTKEPTTTATGTKLYTCTTCSGTKTETIPVLDEDEHRCTWSTQWSSDEVYHWLALTCGCDGRVNSGLHEDADSDEICDVCGYNMETTCISHAWGRWMNYSSTQHKRTCTSCGTSSYGDHDWNDGVTSGNTVTYTCYICDETRVESASSPTPPVEGDTEVTFSLTSETGKPGDTVVIELYVDSSAATNTFGLKDLTYDDSVLTFMGFDNYGTLVSESLVGSMGIDNKNAAISLGYNSAAVRSGKICDLIFRIADDAEDGVFDISMSCVAKAGSTVLSSKVTEGNITVSVQTIGDLTGDDIVDINDVTALLQHSIFPDLYTVSHPGGVDFNHDGMIDIYDVVALLQYSIFPDLYPLN